MSGKEGEGGGAPGCGAEISLQPVESPCLIRLLAELEKLRTREGVVSREGEDVSSSVLFNWQ